MKKIVKHLIILLGVLMIFFPGPVFCLNFTLIQLNIGGPGDTVRWGYEITNNTDLSLEADSYGAIASITIPADPSEYVEEILVPDNFIVLTFDFPQIPENYSGILSGDFMEITWLSTVSQGDTISGTAYLSWADDGNTYHEISTTFSATVAVPEPNTLWLLLTGFAPIVFGFRKKVCL